MEEKHEQERRVTENVKAKMQEQLLVKVRGEWEGGSEGVQGKSL